MVFGNLNLEIKSKLNSFQSSKYVKKFVKFFGMDKQTGVLRVKRLRDDAIIPTRVGESIGYDLYCVQSFDIAPNERKTIPIGVAIQITEEGHYARIAPRSSLALLGIDILAGMLIC